MSFFGSLTGSTQRKDIQRGTQQAVDLLGQGKTAATGNINTGYTAADARLSTGTGMINQGTAQSRNALVNGQTQAIGALKPYAQSGSRANTLYGNALGLNGTGAQRSFASNYAASDPFRAQNANTANEALMRVLNARGLSGSGYAGEAVAQQSLARGSEDYQNYLSRLAGMQAQGQSAAGQEAGIYGNTAQGLAGLDQNRTNALMALLQQRAQGSIGRGNALADLEYGNAQQNANLRMGEANAVAGTRSIGINNLMKLGELNTKAAAAFMGGM